MGFIWISRISRIPSSPLKVRRLKRLLRFANRAVTGPQSVRRHAEPARPICENCLAFLLASFARTNEHAPIIAKLRFPVDGSLLGAPDSNETARDIAGRFPIGQTPLSLIATGMLSPLAPPRKGTRVREAFFATFKTVLLMAESFSRSWFSRMKTKNRAFLPARIRSNFLHCRTSVLR